MTLKAVLYDHDGTIVDSEFVHYQLWAQVLAGFGIDFEVDVYVNHHAGLPTMANAQDAVERFQLGIEPSELVRLKEQASEAYLTQQPFPLMADTLSSIAFFRDKGLTLGVVTGTDRANIDSSIRGHNLASEFATVVCGDDVAHNKPAPDCYQLALQRLNLQPQECIAIEDTPHGAKAADAAGIKCVVVPNRMTPDVDFQSAIQVCESLEQATQWIAKSYL